MKRWLICLVLLLQTFFAVAAFAAPAVPPKPSGNGIYVQDYAGVISASDKQQMLALGQDLDKKTTAQVAVLTVKSLEGYPIEEYALEVLRQWGIGSKDKNNGVLLLISTGDRRSRIEVGYGLEGVLPDGLTGRIQDRYMIPYFKSGNYSKGILQGYKATVLTVAKSYGVTDLKTSGAAPQQKQNKASNGWENLLLIGGLILLLIVDNLFLGGFITQTLLWSIFFRGGGRGGGGGGFGGGSGGGGGSSRSW
ncbi:TPM domain-containing protein [Phascolarctobacterium sp.]|uniref:TPM domain-containing protein n=1 Tax=Phascolarctobacterium sp. TaxID=2049039 RepID=UPI003867EFA1